MRVIVLSCESRQRWSAAWTLLRILENPYSAKMMADNAYTKAMDQFNWGRIAEQTAAVYERVWSEYRSSDWGGGRCA